MAVANAIVNELKCAVRARLILRWATMSKHTKYSEHVSTEIDTRVQENLKVLRSIAGDTEYKAACVAAGAVPALVSLLSSSKGNETQWAAGALANIAWGDAARVAA